MMSQADRMLEVLKDCQPHSTPDLLLRVYGSEHLGIARVGARIFDLKAKLPEGYEIRSWRDPKRKTVWVYQLVKLEPAKEAELFPSRLGVSP